GSAPDGNDYPAMADLGRDPLEPLSLADDQTTAAKLTIRPAELPEDLAAEPVELPAEEVTTEQPALEEPVQAQFDLLTLPSDCAVQSAFWCVLPAFPWGSHPWANHSQEDTIKPRYAGKKRPVPRPCFFVPKLSINGKSDERPV
ncbi:MAG: hypothetical protein IKF77_09095, partial [Thermoguttaceae bacterium]|nr:hypothetical protein [Thermoguttaceae bacterium]